VIYAGAIYGEPIYGSLSYTVVLGVSNLSQAQALTPPALTQASSLSLNSLSQAQALTSPALTQASSLSLNSLSQAQALTSPALTQASLLVPSSLLQGQALSAPDPIQASILTLQSLLQGHTLTPAQLSTLQYARPTSDVALGAWEPSTGTNLYAMLDEALEPDYADYISTTSASICQVGLSSLSDPDTALDHVLRYSAKGDGSTDLVVRFKQGVTTIATWTETNVPATDTDYEHTLTEAQANAITNYSQLSVEFEAA
jgi:hypothetical protein